MVDGRSYPIIKSQGISKMFSAFKDYSKLGMVLIMSANELTRVNLQRVRNFYANSDSTPMPQLKESPGLRIIYPTKAGDGYWNYDNMAA